MQSLNRLIRDDEGASAIEYTFLASLIAMAAVAAMTAMGTSLAQKFSQIAASLT